MKITARRGSSIQGVAFQITDDFANYGYLLSLDWSKCFELNALLMTLVFLSVGQTSVRMSGLINNKNSLPKVVSMELHCLPPALSQGDPMGPILCLLWTTVATLSVVRSPLMLPLPSSCCLWMIVLSSPSLAASAQRSSWFD